MKKILVVVTAVLVSAVLLAACGIRTTDTADTDKISVVATIFAPFDFARQIAGDKAEVTMLLPPGSESHSYEPTPQDIIAIQNCDVFIYAGGDSDAWVESILDSMNTSNIRIVTLMDCVDVVEEEIVEGMQDDEHDHENDDEHAEDEHSKEEHPEEEHDHEGEVEYDEHVWTSPKNAKLIVQKISDAIVAADTSNAQTYQLNTTEYLGKLDKLDTKFQNIVEASVRREIIFGDRFPFRYLADTYGLTYYAAFPGCSTETEASAATVAFLIDKVEEDQIPVVFHIELSNEKMCNTISESVKDNTGRDIKVLLLHACHNVSMSDFENGATYLSLMEGNVETLKEALQ
ncbi:MAG: metal ABC transporter substrate-binding protein [Clostridium sp.]|jgi:zinc transport system substrate-binding protein|nr:metal ABC transporter substrate-binding protein [Clostridium sp.]